MYKSRNKSGEKLQYLIVDINVEELCTQNYFIMTTSLDGIKVIF
jgi:hypothetical protein